MEFYFGYLIGVIIWGVIWGFVAKAVITNRGYEEEGTKYFWLGFFFAFIPVIVAATKPVYQSKWSSSNISNSSSTSSYNSTVNSRIPENGWRCSNCGRIHCSYESGCLCGKSRFEVRPVQAVEQDTTTKTMPKAIPEVNKNSSIAQIDEIKQYKELLDSGILTKEEFDAKKKQLLGL